MYESSYVQKSNMYKRNDDQHCVKSFRIWSYSGSYFSAFGLNTEGYSVFSPNAGKCGPE